ncbi:hypothetical protein E8E11_001966 [Didymella keratinophila]|nr:hypothetical protein E8E11_001966 [Didymella keratinophila]
MLPAKSTRHHLFAYLLKRICPPSTAISVPVTKRFFIIQPYDSAISSGRPKVLSRLSCFFMPSFASAGNVASKPCNISASIAPGLTMFTRSGARSTASPRDSPSADAPQTAGVSHPGSGFVVPTPPIRVKDEF